MCVEGYRIADYSSNAYVLEGQGGNNSYSQIAFTLSIEIMHILKLHMLVLYTVMVLLVTG